MRILDFVFLVCCIIFIRFICSIRIVIRWWIFIYIFTFYINWYTPFWFIFVFILLLLHHLLLLSSSVKSHYLTSMITKCIPPFLSFCFCVVHTFVTLFGERDFYFNFFSSSALWPVPAIASWNIALFFSCFFLFFYTIFQLKSFAYSLIVSVCVCMRGWQFIRRPSLDAAAATHRPHALLIVFVVVGDVADGCLMLLIAPCRACLALVAGFTVGRIHNWFYVCEWPKWWALKWWKYGPYGG